MKKISLFARILTLGVFFVSNTSIAAQLLGSIRRHDKNQTVKFSLALKQNGTVRYTMRGQTETKQGPVSSDVDFSGIKIEKWVPNGNASPSSDDSPEIGYDRATLLNDVVIHFDHETRTVRNGGHMVGVTLAGSFGTLGYGGYGFDFNNLVVGDVMSVGKIWYEGGLYRPAYDRSVSFGGSVLSSSVISAKDHPVFMVYSRYEKISDVHFRFGNLQILGSIDYSGKKDVETSCFLSFDIKRADGADVNVLAVEGAKENTDEGQVRNFLAFIELIGFDLCRI